MSLSATPEEYDLLYGLVRATQPEVAVETGTGEGKGAECIAGALEANRKGHLWTVDMDERPVPGARVTCVQGNSLKCIADFDRPIDFAFVDCFFGQDRLLVVEVLLNRGTRTVVLHDTIKLKLKLDAPRRPDLELDTPCGMAIWRSDGDR